ncbi:MAG: PadR family transcriptional regulator [Actinomycetota bacterium]|nr:PadR family transcriptional regulator [Actinomycetota bacterium]
MEPGGARVLTQLRRGVLEHCVLALMADHPRYGFELVSELGRSPALVITEGTIYPLLARLRRDGLVVTSWQESESGPPRRYYGLTEDGRRALGRFAEDWREFRDAVDTVLGASPAGPDEHDTTCRCTGGDHR